jgi:hypothetical protein
MSTSIGQFIDRVLRAADEKPNVKLDAVWFDMEKGMQFVFTDPSRHARYSHVISYFDRIDPRSSIVGLMISSADSSIRNTLNAREEIMIQETNPDRSR